MAQSHTSARPLPCSRPHRTSLRYASLRRSGLQFATPPRISASIATVMPTATPMVATGKQVPSSDTGE